MSNVIETIKGPDDWCAKLYYDEDPGSPRGWDNYAELILFHRRYTLGDKHGFRHGDYDGWEELAAAIESDRAPLRIWPVAMYDHSGLAFTIGAAGAFACDQAGWDSGQIGFAIVTEERLRAGFGKGPAEMTPEDWTIIEGAVRGELEVYERYVNGDCYGYQVEDADGEEADSCWGFYGLDDAMEAAREALADAHAAFIKQKQEAAALVPLDQPVYRADESKVAVVVRALLEASVWFGVTPLPDGIWEVTVKPGDGSVLRSCAL